MPINYINSENNNSGFLNQISNQLMKNVLGESITYEKFAKYDNIWRNFLSKFKSKNMLVVKFEAKQNSSKSYLSGVAEKTLEDSDMYDRFFRDLDFRGDSGRFACISIPPEYTHLIKGFYLVPLKKKISKGNSTLKRKFNISLNRDRNLILGFIVGHDTTKKNIHINTICTKQEPRQVKQILSRRLTKRKTEKPEIRKTLNRNITKKSTSTSIRQHSNGTLYILTKITPDGVINQDLITVNSSSTSEPYTSKNMKCKYCNK